MNINDYKDGNGNVEVSETLVSDIIDEINGVADYVVEQGTDYTKWASGKMECSGSVHILGANEGNSRTISYPVSFVGSNPRVFTQLYRNAAALGTSITIVVDESASTTNGFSVFHTSTVQINVYCNWFAIGRWK